VIYGENKAVNFSCGQRFPTVPGINVNPNYYSFSILGDSYIPQTKLLGSSGSSAPAPSSSMFKRDFCSDFQNVPDQCFRTNLPAFQTQLVLYKYQLFVLVGGIVPVTLSIEFDADLGLGVDFNFCIIGLTCDGNITPQVGVTIKATLSLGIGGVLSINFDVDGTVADTHIPITGQFPLSSFPVGTCLGKMDKIICLQTYYIAFSP
jgi:hypothetical protein